MLYKCAFCKGTGKDPYHLFSELSICPVCRGRRKVDIGGSAIGCAYCKGSGKDKGGKVPCGACRGRGVFGMHNPERCLVCNGSGRAKIGLTCLKCRGCGSIEGMHKISKKAIAKVVKSRATLKKKKKKTTKKKRKK